MKRKKKKKQKDGCLNEENTFVFSELGANGMRARDARLFAAASVLIVCVFFFSFLFSSFLE